MKNKLIFVSMLAFVFNISVAAVDENGCELVDFDEAEQNAMEKANHSKEKKPAKQLYISDEGLREFAAGECLRLKPYDDKDGKEINSYNENAAIGFAHLIQSRQEFAKYKNGISKEEALKLYREDLIEHENAVREAIKIKVNQNQFDAMLSLSFNIGAETFKQSSVVKLINNPHAKTPYKDLESAWKAFNKIDE